MLPRLLALMLLVACDDPAPQQQDERVESEEASSEGQTRRALIEMADRRVAPDQLAEALASGDAEARRQAALSLSRLHDPAAIPLLRRGLRDVDPEVRRNASLGLGALEESAPPAAERLLLSALAAEGVRDNRAAYLWDLGRVAGEGALGVFRHALADTAGPIREAACRGLGGYGLRRRSLDPALLRRVATRVRDDRDPAVRLSCAHALSRIEPPPEGAERDAIRQDLLPALEDPEAEVRAFAVRALGSYPGAEEAIARRALDPDWQVATQAFRSLGRHVEEDRGRLLGQVFRRAFDAALEDRRLSPTESHVLTTGLAAMAGAARNEPVFAVSREAFERLSEPPGDVPLSRAWGLTHCRAATLYDLGRGWPNTVDECGLEQVSEEERRLMAVEVLAHGEGSESQRSTYLRRLFDEGGPRVREAVLTAAPSIPDPDLSALVLRALEGDDPGVVITACDAVAGLAETWAETVGGDAPVLSIRPAGEPGPAVETAHRRGPPLSRIHRGLAHAHDTLLEGQDLEGLQSWINAARAIGDAGFLPQLRALAAHYNPAVRDAARRALPADAEVDPPAAVPNPISTDAIPEPSTIRVTLHTQEGPIVVALDAASAPTTVGRFVALAQDGFYDGLSFHRVVPAFVVQGGDPRGDGYGGPGFSQRCEDNRRRYERGTIGMALSGRDTGGSQFFITHGPQPHLEGRYTAFGRVEDGMDVVDRLLVGARIERIEAPVSRETDEPTPN